MRDLPFTTMKLDADKATVLEFHAGKLARYLLRVGDQEYYLSTTLERWLLVDITNEEPEYAWAGVFGNNRDLIVQYADTPGEVIKRDINGIRANPRYAG